MQIDTTLLQTMFDLFVTLFEYVAPISLVICLCFVIIKIFIRGVTGRI